MREQLIRYVDLLFAGAPDSGDIKQEILQNTLDRYDDLIGQGKSPEAAYSLSISGIGDITEILSGSGTPHPEQVPTAQPPKENTDTKEKRAKRAAAIAMYILCPVPLFILGSIGSGVLGLCLMFLMIAAATALIILSGGKDERKQTDAPKSELHKAVDTVIWVVGLCAYFLVSFSTGAWYITWLIFPMIGTVQGIGSACVDLVQRRNSTSNSVVRIILFALASLLLTGLLLAGLGVGMFMFELDGTGSYISGSGSVKAEEVTDIAIEWAAGDILIETGDTDTISFSESGYADDGQEMVYTLRGKTLSISYGKPTVQIGFGSVPKKDLTITVPKGWICEKLDIDSASTDAVIRDLSISKVELDSASNAFLFSRCSIGSMDVDGASNSIEILGALDTLDCDGMSTTIKAILLTAPSTIDMDGMSSKLDLTLQEDWGFRVSMDGLSNDFHSDFTTSTRDGRYVHGDGSFLIEVDGLSSSVYIRSTESGCTHIWDDNSCIACGMGR